MLQYELFKKQVIEILEGVRNETDAFQGSPMYVEQLVKELTNENIDNDNFDTNGWQWDWWWKIEINGIDLSFSGCGWYYFS
jgi:hypothetical protein